MASGAGSSSTCDEKTIDSRVRYLKDEEPQEPPSALAPELVVPHALSPSSSDEDFQVYTHVAADRRHDWQMTR